MTFSKQRKQKTYKRFQVTSEPYHYSVRICDVTFHLLHRFPYPPRGSFQRSRTYPALPPPQLQKLAPEADKNKRERDLSQSDNVKELLPLFLLLPISVEKGEKGMTSGGRIANILM